jgi:hypothetical protein
VNVTRCSSKPYRFDAPFVGGDYALLLYVAATDVSAEKQTEISEAIVASGCRYVVCYGHRCSSWDDSIDVASIDAGKAESDFVMTSWHEDDTPDDVAFFFWHNTAFDNFTAERKGLFVIGSNSKIEAAIETAVAMSHDKRKKEANQALEPTSGLRPAVAHL